MSLVSQAVRSLSVSVFAAMIPAYAAAQPVALREPVACSSWKLGEHELSDEMQLQCLAAQEGAGTLRTVSTSVLYSEEDYWYSRVATTGIAADAEIIRLLVNERERRKPPKGQSSTAIYSALLLSGQIEKAAFQIGADQFFELPVGKLSALSEAEQSSGEIADQANSAAASDPSRYQVGSRPQAIALLEQVQRFFRHAEPSSPVPMLCDRARALAERDFMGVLKEVLPKSALKTLDK